MAPDTQYSPRRRTALVLAGTGTAGAYHAGVLQALQEAGVKIDIVGGAGIGAVGALFSAVDGGSRLWDKSGLWRGARSPAAYPWNSRWRSAAIALGLLAALAVIPIVWFAIATLILFLAFAGQLTGVMDATTVDTAVRTTVGAGGVAGMLFAVLPRIAYSVLLVIIAAAIVLAAASRVQAHLARSTDTSSLAAGPPFDGRPTIARMTEALWGLIRGAAPGPQPTGRELADRYVELLGENLGQPGFRELIVTAHDLDTRRDLVFVLLAPDYRRAFFGRKGEVDGPRRGELGDLAGVGREQLTDVLGGALSVPLVCAPHTVTFSPDSFWRGETHRVCYRPDAVIRLVEEAIGAGAEQVILVSTADETEGPHALRRARHDLLGRAGEHVASSEASAVRTAAARTGEPWAAIFVIRPPYNPVGPFDAEGSFDSRSNRHQPVSELVDRGYEDAYRQFIEPVVGASGERLTAVLQAAMPIEG